MTVRGIGFLAVPTGWPIINPGREAGPGEFDAMPVYLFTTEMDK